MFVYVCVYVYVYVCVYVCLYMCVCVVYVCVFVYVYVCVYVYMCMCMCMCVYVYVCSIESAGGQYTGVRPSVDAEPKVCFISLGSSKVLQCVHCHLHEVFVMIHTPD